MEHRQEQIKAEEIKLRSMQLNIERLEGDMGKLQEEMRVVKDQNSQQAQRLEDASALLQVIVLLRCRSNTAAAAIKAILMGSRVGSPVKVVPSSRSEDLTADCREFWLPVMVLDGPRPLASL